ncbi:MAG: hypothetical protein V4731_06040 [Pseudomonadota bacterium]
MFDRTFRIAGIITLAEFLRATDLDLHEGFDGKLRHQRLVGIITQTDLVVALTKSEEPARTSA